MRFATLKLFILILLFSFHSKAADYAEPAVFDVINTKDYYKDSHGYNMQSACRGMMCIPAGSKVGCSDYSYPSHKAISGATLQVCHISTINNAERNVSIDVRDQDFTMVTGIIRDGKISYNLPAGEAYIATRWRILHHDKKQETKETAVQSPSLLDPFRVTEAGVCIPGVTCPSTDPCKNPGPLSTLLCAKTTLGNYVAPFSPLRSSEAADPNFDHKKIAEAFVLGSSDKYFNPLCSSFIDKTGHLGPRGRKVLDAIEKVGTGCFYGGEGSINVSGVCPNFNKFSKKQKDYFWVWVYASIATDESKCGHPRWLVNPKATNGIGYGLFQLGGDREKRNAGRSKTYCPRQGSNRNFNHNDDRYQMECATSILRDTTCKRGWALNGGSGYWAELRGNGEVSKLIRKYPGCK